MGKPTWNKKLADLWDMYPAPIRPSSSCISIFELYVELVYYRTKGKGNVLILGSTPELRDIVANYNLHSTVVDHSQNIYEALSTLLFKSNVDEEFIEQDWCCLNLEKKYDLILAEASINVLKRDDVDIFLTNILNHLNGAGLFVSKTWVTPVYIPDIKDLIIRYRKLWSQNDFYSYSCAYLWEYCKDELGVISLKDMHVLAEDFYNDNIISLNEWESIRKLNYDTLSLELFIPDREWILKKYKSYFNIESILQADFVNSSVYPFVVLHK